MRNETPIYLDAWAAEQKSPWNYFIFEEDTTTFQLTIPFCYAPTLQREAFLEELLTVNLNLLYGKFTYNAKDNVVALIYRLPGLRFQPADLTHVMDGLMYYSEMAYHVLKDEFAYHHDWEDGDIVISEQWLSIHKRWDFEGMEDRILHRIAFDYSNLYE